MLSDRTSKALSGVSKATLNKGVRVKHLFRIMTHYPDLWMRAYSNIYSNRGAMTEGVDGKTLDGMSNARIKEIIDNLKEGTYSPKPVKRVYIPKKEGKKRPLGIPSGDDKLVQEVVRILLEQVYEPVFQEESYGFRPNRSCLLALNDIRKTWSGVKWIADMDIKGFYDNVNNSKLIELLEKKIDDRKFIKLIKSLLSAGVMEDWVLSKTYSGVPQGGICSPILANVYLHELDLFMKNLVDNFNKGKTRKISPEYIKLQTGILRAKNQLFDAKKRGGVLPFFFEEMEKHISRADERRRSISYYDTADEGFKRLRYARYADDFIVGICGSKQDVQEIFDQIRGFLKSKLLLDVADEKSGIHHITDGVDFLGYHIYGNPNLTRQRKTKCGVTKDGRTYYGTRRSATASIALEVPKEKVWEFCKRNGYIRKNYKPHPRNMLLHLDDLSIIKTFNAEMQGFANYYCLAPRKRLFLMEWAGISSLYHTLAKKHKSSCMKMKTKTRVGDEHGIFYEVKGQRRFCKIFKVKHLKEPDFTKSSDVVANAKIFSNRNTEILTRYNAGDCEYCGIGDKPVEIHHLRKLADVKAKPNKSALDLKMAALHRKTIILCVDCHNQLHSGQLPAWKRDFYKDGEPSAVKAARSVRRGDHVPTDTSGR